MFRVSYSSPKYILYIIYTNNWNRWKRKDSSLWPSTASSVVVQSYWLFIDSGSCQSWIWWLCPCWVWWSGCGCKAAATIDSHQLLMAPINKPKSAGGVSQNEEALEWGTRLFLHGQLSVKDQSYLQDTYSNVFHFRWYICAAHLMWACMHSHFCKMQFICMVHNATFIVVRTICVKGSLNRKYPLLIKNSSILGSEKSMRTHVQYTVQMGRDVNLVLFSSTGSIPSFYTNQLYHFTLAKKRKFLPLFWFWE